VRGVCFVAYDAEARGGELEQEGKVMFVARFDIGCEMAGKGN
jgi:hypothetical protein